MEENKRLRKKKNMRKMNMREKTDMIKKTSREKSVLKNIMKKRVTKMNLKMKYDDEKYYLFEENEAEKNTR